MRLASGGLGLTGVVTSIGGLTAARAAFLAESGDGPVRHPRAEAGHARLCPPDNACGQQQGKSVIWRRGRSALRLAAWRAVLAALPSNQPGAGRQVARLTTRNDNRLTRQQACAARAAALLRWLHVLITRRVHLEPGHPRQPQASAHGRLTQATTASPGGASPNGAPWKMTSRMSMGSSARLPATSIARCRGQPGCQLAGGSALLAAGPEAARRVSSSR